MTFFKTDKQTLDDLNIFGRQGSDSVYSIFNRCATRGGAAVLEEMFRYPLANETSIKRRCGIIQYFSSLEAPFPFPLASFDAIEPYLANTDERTRISAQNRTIGAKLGNLIAVNTETSIIHQGITALAELLKTLYDFVSSLNLSGDDGYYTEAREIVALLKDQVFHPVLNQPEGKLAEETLSSYDGVFRFSHKDTVQKLLRYIYHLDVYLAAGKVARERKLCFPSLVASVDCTTIEGLYHPLVQNAVPNSVQIDGENNVIFLTGANMAGKSTFMKSLGIAMFLAHMGFPVAAKRMEFSVMDGIFTNINLPDNLSMGASHFYAEVLRLKKIAKELASGAKLFVVFDELFRGTNVKDAYEATLAITSAFARKRNGMFVISTHIIEAGQVLREKHQNIRFIYLPTLMQGSKPVYTYRLEEGITDDRHGMLIINNERIIEILEAGIKIHNNI
ncbi:MutS-related protein [Pedobacter faecalis]|uniref:MutS-related protein n=1 Tax=Pedobacter faecalis TaxID=3041495 RepID=UPI002551734B|nr:DNA mismatch repair protein [Pedobacter sp. ELA7]